jgi:dynactin 1
MTATSTKETRLSDAPCSPLPQITTLKSAIRFLRGENSYLKAQGLLGDVRALPCLDRFETIPPVPVLERDDADTSVESSDESVDGPVTPPPSAAPASRHTLDVRSKLLWREIAESRADARVVDLTKIKPGKAWRSIKVMPEVQLEEMMRDKARLARKVERHVEQGRRLMAAR